MAGARVLGGKSGLRVEGRGPILRGEHGEFVAALETIGPASLSSLLGALRRSADRPSFHAPVNFIDQPTAKVAGDPDRYLREPVAFHYWSPSLSGGREFSIFAESYGDPDDGLPDASGLERLIDPYLAYHGATASVGVDADESDWGGAYQLGISIEFPIRGRTVNDAYLLGKGLVALVEAAEHRAVLTRETALGVLRGGRADVLVGQTETQWIDFKRDPYKNDDHGKFELAKDVAAFANAGGGLLVLGVAVTRSGHVETASKIMPCAAGAVSVHSYRAIIAPPRTPSTRGG